MWLACLFFFFKQKTAYEMRISDWSSTCALPIWLAHFGGDELVLGLRREFGIGQLDRDDRRQPLAHVVTGQVDLLLLEQPRFVRIGVDRAGQRGAECGHVRAAVALRAVDRKSVV